MEVGRGAQATVVWTLLVHLSFLSFPHLYTLPSDIDGDDGDAMDGIEREAARLQHSRKKLYGTGPMIGAQKNTIVHCLHQLQHDCQVVIDMIEHQKALMVELHGIVMPILPSGNDQTKLAVQLLGDILSCSDKAISMLEFGSDTNKLTNIVGGKRRSDKHSMENQNLEEGPKEIGNKRRKNAEHTGSTVAQAPHNDGHQWRKYGQKSISRSKHSRSYYRCANSKVQGCPATKTVQQMNSSGNGTLKLFNVDYYGQHTCRGDGIASPYVVDTAHHNMEPNNQTKCNSPTPEHEVQDERFQNLCMVPNMPEHLIEFEMERAFEFTMNSRLDTEHWMFDDSVAATAETQLRRQGRICYARPTRSMNPMHTVTVPVCCETGMQGDLSQQNQPGEKAILPSRIQGLFSEEGVEEKEAGEGGRCGGGAGRLGAGERGKKCGQGWIGGQISKVGKRYGDLRTRWRRRYREGGSHKPQRRARRHGRRGGTSRRGREGLRAKKTDKHRDFIAKLPRKQADSMGAVYGL
uniref:WRKY domain-containing protein n=1 Tax=Leersia perrieri TaxID=77586 RepID=A0A0D9XNF1_9ORYZ